MFDSIYTSIVTPGQFFLMALVTIISGFLFSWVMSFCVRSTKRFFIVIALIPFVVAAAITFVNGNSRDRRRVQPDPLPQRAGQRR